MAKQKNPGLNEEITLAGVSAKMEGNKLIIEKGNEKIERKMGSVVTAEVLGDKIILKTKKSNKLERRTLGSLAAHIKNAIKGLSEPFQYKLQVASVHFPITLTHDKTNHELVVKNFLGEKKDRKIKIVPGVNVKINKDLIELECFDIEKAGQTAANIEKGTKVRNRDRRIFQDGIFITEKPGRSFL